MAKIATPATVDSVDDGDETSTLAERRTQTSIARGGVAAQITALEAQITSAQTQLDHLDAAEREADEAAQRAERSLEHAERETAHSKAGLLTSLSESTTQIMRDQVARQEAERDAARVRVGTAHQHAAQVAASAQAGRVTLMGAIADADAARSELQAVLSELDAQGADLETEAGQRELESLREEVRRLTSRQQQAREAEASATVALRHLKASIRGRFAAHPGRVRDADAAFPPDPEIIPAVQVLEAFDTVLEVLDQGQIAPTLACYPGPLNLVELLELSRGQVEGLLRGDPHCRQMFDARRHTLREAAAAWQRYQRRREMGQAG